MYGRTKNIFPILNKIFLLACLAHLMFMAYYLAYPERPAIEVYRKNIKQIEFPILFRVCVDEIDNISSRFQKAGYTHYWYLFYGKSMHLNRTYGWNSHTKNGSTVGSVRGITN